MYIRSPWVREGEPIPVEGLRAATAAVMRAW
eukprot:SAG11_NODE_13712_length_642_cov_2.009208_1_plen_30_part_10